MSFICQYCQRNFKLKHHLKRHIDEKRCKFLKVNPDHSMVEEVASLKKQLEDLKQTMSSVTSLEKRLEIQEAKPVVNNILNVICVSNNDNYLDMLTERTGDFNQAIDYIKECALSDLSGDCKLIEKIYMNEPTQIINNICFADTGRNKVTYFNEKMEQINDNRTSFGRKLANNLQNSYLKGINYLINKKLNEQTTPSKFLEEYDIQTWNTHIYNLSDMGYQRKIINQLQIPTHS